MSYISLYKSIFICGLLLAVSAIPAGSADIFDLLINDDITVSNQFRPRLAVDDSGMISIVWADERNGSSDIYSQLLDTVGIKSGSNRKLNDNSDPSIQQEPALDVLDSGRYLSVWKDYRNGSYPFGPNIYAAVLDSANVDNNLNAAPNLVDIICETPDVAVLSDGSAIVVWADYRNNNWDIFGRRLTAAGALLGSDFKINSDGGLSQQHTPRIAAFDHGGFVVAWYDNRMGDDDIFFQRFDSSAAPLSGNIRASDDLTAARQAFPAVAADRSGRFFIAWIDWCNGVYPANPDIYLRRFGSSGAALALSKKVNGNDNSRSQRDVSICSDRVGNICITWADSVTGQWDAMAQLIDRDGLKSGSNFLVHEETTGKQLQPDVITDGYKLIFAWADYRSGNFDIYATIKDFNNPGLIPSPTSLDFIMEQGGSLPSSQTITLSNNGLGELNWAAVAEADWLSVNPLSGITPSGFDVSIATDTLAYGTYSGEIRLIDIDYADSSQTIQVNLTVTAPLIDVQPDTLSYRILKKLGDPEPLPLVIENRGSGTLNWTGSESVPWMSLGATSGAQGDTVLVNISTSDLTVGDNWAPIEFISIEAANSPETVWVYAELLDRMPYIDPVPDSFVFNANIGETLTGRTEIKNAGDDHLAWTAVPADDWVEIDRTTGSEREKINITIESATLPTGYHYTGITVYDSTSFNVEVFIPIEIYLSSGDTVQFMNSNVMPGQIGLMPVYITLISPTKGGYVPFGFDSSTAALDSIVINDYNMPDFVDYSTAIASGGVGELGFRVTDSLFDDSAVSAGTYHIADLFFTAGESEVLNTVDTLSSDSAGPYILIDSIEKVVPTIIPGDLIIGNPTAVEDGDLPILPEKISLGQNYPNPFNSTTVIKISLPRAQNVEINIYNILGQEVLCLLDGPLSAGEHQITWNGHLSVTTAAPSGIYFYRLISSEFSDVRKMVLIK